WQKGLENRGWNSLYLSNHDQPRAVSRFGDDGRYRVESAKMLATFLHMQQGTPYIYQGEEIGMTNVRFEAIEDYRDIETLNMYREASAQPDFNVQKVMEAIYAKGRDNARTPVQWDGTPNAGFTTGTPWIKVNPNYSQINVQQALADPGSIFHYYQKLIQLRKEHPIMVYGTYGLILEDHPEIYAFTRTLGAEKLLVMLNFRAGAPVFELPAGLPCANPQLLISNYEIDPAEDLDHLVMRPYEARVYRIT
ncbi:MAG: alpha-amylase family glycosyl hydrolase, partial [Anaerolineales bacterium]|nr:alpha-amylase family glycosyl hydrolase [Anaerolineales bacterium]